MCAKAWAFSELVSVGINPCPFASSCRWVQRIPNIFLLAGIAGHSGLAFNNRWITIPCQGCNTSLQDYMQSWKHFLHINHCCGITYSDVYFVETWLERLHSTYNETLKLLILGLLQDCLLDVPVPIPFTAKHLISYVTASAPSIGIYTLKALTTPASGHLPLHLPLLPLPRWVR